MALLDRGRMPERRPARTDLLAGAVVGARADGPSQGWAVRGRARADSGSLPEPLCRTCRRRRGRPAGEAGAGDRDPARGQRRPMDGHGSAGPRPWRTGDACQRPGTPGKRTLTQSTVGRSHRVDASDRSCRLVVGRGCCQQPSCSLQLAIVAVGRAEFGKSNQSDLAVPGTWPSATWGQGRSLHQRGGGVPLA
jgi:hypothetical protein